MEQVGWFWRYGANDKVDDKNRPIRPKNSKWWFTTKEPDDEHSQEWDIQVIGAYADPNDLEELQ